MFEANQIVKVRNGHFRNGIRHDYARIIRVIHTMGWLVCQLHSTNPNKEVIAPTQETFRALCIEGGDSPLDIRLFPEQVEAM